MKKKILLLTLTLSMIASSVTPFRVKAEETRVSQLLGQMSLKQKVTQMLMVDFRYWDETPLSEGQTEHTPFTQMNDQVKQIVEDYDFGAIIYFAQNLVETEQAYNLTMAMQEAATKDNGIAMLVSADQEGGNVFRLGSGTALPGNMALGATGDTNNAYLAGKVIGSELSVLGINTDLAPVVDVNNNANNPVIGLRSYGDNAEAVGNMASASIAGMAEYNVIGCAKHFPGHGDTATDSHYGLPSVDKSKEVLLENELKPYEVAIDQGIEMIMTAHILYPQLESDKIVSEKTGQEESLPATMSDDIITGLLKEEMGFEGIVVTDAMNMAGISDNWDQVQSVVIAISAGADMICMPCQLYDMTDLEDLDAIIDGVIAAVEDGTIPESRIDDAVTRILTVKENRGILDYDAADYSLQNAVATVGSDENRATEREIAAAAVTVVKNEDNVLPVQTDEDSKILLLAPYNNETSQMLWGVARGKQAEVISSQAQVKVAKFSSTDLNATVTVIDESGNSSEQTMQELLDWCNVLIINSEISSTKRMAYKHWLSAAPNAFIDYVETNTPQKVTIVQSVDKPYDVQLYDNADAVMAVYGCKGSSVDPTEALVGGATGDTQAVGPNITAGIEVAFGVFGANGKLPVNIPRYDVDSDTYTSEIVYQNGYGITYAAADKITDEPDNTPNQPDNTPSEPDNTPNQPNNTPIQPISGNGTLLLAADGNWYYAVNGHSDSTYTGFASNAYGWWYVKNGVVDLNYTGMACDGTNWWYITNGALDFSYTGMAQNEHGWWYITNGALDWTYTGMALNDYGWWYMTNGALDWTYTGMALNDYGWWYMTNGALDFGYTGMALNDYGWWYMTNSALDFGYTGMAINDYGWWYMTNGALDWTYTGMALNDYGWWYITNGALDLSYTGIAVNEYGQWQFVNGQLVW